MLGLAYAFSTNRRAIRLETVAWGLGLQFVFAVFVLRIDAGRRAFQKAGDVVNQLLSYAFVGSQFVFGDLGSKARISASTSPSRCCRPSFSSLLSSLCSITMGSCSSSSRLQPG